MAGLQMRGRGRAAVGLLATLALAGCSTDHAYRAGPARGAIDEQTGSYGGVQLGESDADVVAGLGKAEPYGSPPYITPNVSPPYLLTASNRDIVYPDVTITSFRGRVTAITIYGIGAHTLSGVTIGDGFDQARAATGALCQPAHGGQQPRDPSCQLKVSGGVYLYFAGSPVKVITLSSRSVFA